MQHANDIKWAENKETFNSVACICQVHSKTLYNRQLLYQMPKHISSRTACKCFLKSTPIYVGEYMCNSSSTFLPTDRYAHLSSPWTSAYQLPLQNRTSCSCSMCGKGGDSQITGLLSLPYLFLSVAWGSHSNKCYLFSEEELLSSNGAQRVPIKEKYSFIMDTWKIH